VFNRFLILRAARRRAYFLKVFLDNKSTQELGRKILSDAAIQESLGFFDFGTKVETNLAH